MNLITKSYRHISILIFSFIISFLVADAAAQTLDAFNPNANVAVDDIEILSDGKMMIGGQFTSIGGTTRNSLARLNADGTLDTTFPSVANLGNVLEIIVQPDGKLLISGGFSLINGVTRNRLARLNADGTLDATFDAGFSNVGTGVNRISLQPDGKVIVPGIFSNSSTVRRVNADGTADATFSLRAFNTFPAQATVLPDGKILVNGSFSTVDGITRRGLIRLNTDGTVDSTFNASLAAGFAVFLITVAPDAKIYASGTFTSIGGQTRTNFARLNADGTADTSFQDPLVIGSSSSFGPRPSFLQPDGKIVIGGSFDTVGGVARKNLARLNADGSLDTTFRNMLVGVDAFTPASMIKRQPDGKIVVGGAFTTVDGTTRNRVARITPADPVAVGFEGDVAPRPDGDGSMLSTDVTQLRRFVSGLDTPNPATNENQRADCAPRTTSGDGALTSGDVVQGRRYVAGLDPLTPSGGPTTPSFVPESIANLFEDVFSCVWGRELRIGNAKADESMVTIPVEMTPNGDEVAMSFTIEYDAKMLSNPQIVLGDAAPGGAVLTVNTNEDGRIGVLIDGTDAMTASAKPQRIVSVTFNIAAEASGETGISLTGALADKGVSDAAGITLAMRYFDGIVHIIAKK